MCAVRVGTTQPEIDRGYLGPPLLTATPGPALPSKPRAGKCLVYLDANLPHGFLTYTEPSSPPWPSEPQRPV